jgi:Mg/Co/Ni transporter MgtE
MTDPAAADALIRSICTLSQDDYGDVLRRLEDPAHARLLRGSTWSIFKALDSMDRDDRADLLAKIVAQRAKTSKVTLAT